MKVFISWSGTTSHKVGLIFREWLPSVIQSLEPYVSSEDIDKGARWSTDIAKELEDSTFGILCVTKDNLHAPWLSFEAGALSKTMDKSFVTPFLFDIKRSEVNGPILQFQSTIFDKDDVKKLLNTLNKACGEVKISQSMLDKAFEVWYPTLETELNKLKDTESTMETEVEDIVAEVQNTSIIEEILELSRDNQKLLRNPDVKINDQLAEIKQRIDMSLSRFERNADIDERRMSRKYKPMLIEELMHSVFPKCQKQYKFLIALSLFQDDFPWVYNMGKELSDLIQSNASLDIKHESINDFRRLLEFTCEHPMMRDTFGRRQDMKMLLRDMPYMLSDILKEIEMDLCIS
ncbi:hypothetical protein DSECCO2_441750 [anaerobic digester metagenome]